MTFGKISKHLSHKTADLILDSNYDKPVTLYSHGRMLHFQYESLMWYVHRAAHWNKCRLKVKIGVHTVTISRVEDEKPKLTELMSTSYSWDDGGFLWH